nr:MAG TPA: hypothetical protein [Caudoviricetes sp.]
MTINKLSTKKYKNTKKPSTFFKFGLFCRN